ncbi:unnamed product [Ostreococcus tauri]|uniref:Unnamed product n=1 Tax=Ostreococcus tauri TaxID=70448 RepID=A0A090M7C4_OSTTA|nr:unnamed product [Ostreococcus tauri]CEG00987.1 unnamed product [Ostreococcus tauri]|eukprot:XP_003074955.2 unnamed product [Ostreococcus tauri]
MQFHVSDQEHLRKSEEDVQLLYSKWRFLGTVFFVHSTNIVKKVVNLDRLAMLDASGCALLSETTHLNQTVDTARESVKSVRSKIAWLHLYSEQPETGSLRKLIVRARIATPREDGCGYMDKQELAFRRLQFEKVYCFGGGERDTQLQIDFSGFSLKLCILELVRREFRHYAELFQLANILLHEETSRRGGLSSL